MKKSRFDVPPVGLVTEIGSTPDAPTRIEGTETTICVDVTLAGVSTAVPSMNVVSAVKFEPEIVMMNVALPAAIDVGEIEVMLGARVVWGTEPTVNPSV